MHSFFQHLEKWWHDFVLNHWQKDYMNDGIAGARTACFCRNSDKGYPVTWEPEDWIPSKVWFWEDGNAPKLRNPQTPPPRHSAQGDDERDV